MSGQSVTSLLAGGVVGVDGGLDEWAKRRARGVSKVCMHVDLCLEGELVRTTDCLAAG